MGGFQVWSIEWKDKKSRDYFEKLKLHQRILCVYNYSKEGFGIEVTYFMGFQGYAEGWEFLRKHQKKLNIKKFYSLDLSTRSDWYDQLKNFCE